MPLRKLLARDWCGCVRAPVSTTGVTINSSGQVQWTPVCVFASGSCIQKKTRKTQHPNTACSGCLRKLWNPLASCRKVSTRRAVSGACWAALLAMRSAPRWRWAAPRPSARIRVQITTSCGDLLMATYVWVLLSTLKSTLKRQRARCPPRRLTHGRARS